MCTLIQLYAYLGRLRSSGKNITVLVGMDCNSICISITIFSEDDQLNASMVLIVR